MATAVNAKGVLIGIKTFAFVDEMVGGLFVRGVYDAHVPPPPITKPPISSRLFPEKWSSLAFCEFGAQIPA